MPFLDTQRGALYYNFFEGTQAAAKTVLLVHGFAGTPESDFEGELPYLRGSYRVLGPHLHGYGRSAKREGYSTSYYREDVEDLVALLDELGLRSVLVLAFSDGAIVGLLLAALHPERVEALAIHGAQPSINAENVAAIRYWLLEKPLSEEWQAQLAQLHGEPHWRELPAMYVKAQEDLVAYGGVLIAEEELASIRCPTLVMHGKRDRIVPVEYAYMIHKGVPRSQLLLFDAGHAAHLRCAQEYREAIMNFFREGRLPAARGGAEGEAPHDPL